MTWMKLLRVSLVLLVGLAGLQTTDARAENPCGKPNMVLLVDTSGSMGSDGKLQSMQASVKDVVANFQTKLRFGLMSFAGSSARLHVLPGEGAAHVSRINSAVSSLRASGSTPMRTAVTQVYNYFKTQIIPQDSLKGRPQYLVLMTDGAPTDGDPSGAIQALRSVVVQGRKYDIKTFVIGFGSGRNIVPQNLQIFAQVGGTGNFYHATDRASLMKAFNDAANRAAKEVCDGLDNDCDGKVDNVPQSSNPLSRPCASACGKGNEICKSGKWTGCSASQPKPETCNAKDDDCDGEIDEGVSRPCSTKCGPGKEVCVSGVWKKCDAPQPSPEICDGKDNDCNGQIDDGSLCPGGKCVPNGTGGAECVIGCKTGECPKNFECKNGRCMELPCRRVKCPAGYVCSNKTGDCKDLCEGVTCPEKMTCKAGSCVNCYTEGCGDGRICKDGQCVADPCAVKNCAAGQGCREGKCFASCSGVSCGNGEKCLQGRCVGDPCAGVTCKSNEVCHDGSCHSNVCLSTPQCPDGRICDPKVGCVDDPCLSTRCPAGSKCVEGECQDPNKTPSGNGGTGGGSKCALDTDCATGQSCRNGYCSAAPGGCICGLVASSEGDDVAPGILFMVVFLALGLMLRVRRRRS